MISAIKPFSLNRRQQICFSIGRKEWSTIVAGLFVKRRSSLPSAFMMYSSIAPSLIDLELLPLLLGQLVRKSCTIGRKDNPLTIGRVGSLCIVTRRIGQARVLAFLDVVNDQFIGFVIIPAYRLVCPDWRNSISTFCLAVASGSYWVEANSTRCCRGESKHRLF